jgi:hypothetical protein
MSKSASVVCGGGEETAAVDGNYLFRKFCPFFEFEIVENNVRLRINTREDYKMLSYMGTTSGRN